MEWISVKDRLPEEKDANKWGKVLLLYEDDSCNSQYWQIVDRLPWHKFWMRIPESPKS